MTMLTAASIKMQLQNSHCFETLNYYQIRGKFKKRNLICLVVKLSCQQMG